MGKRWPSVRQGGQCGCGGFQSRLLQVVRWVKGEPDVRDLRRGLHAANTGVAAMLIAAADEPEVGALVLRGGRPDQAGPALPFVAAPTLLVVGADDAPVAARPAFGRSLPPSYGLEDDLLGKGRFPRTGRPHHRYEFAPGDLQVHIL